MYCQCRLCGESKSDKELCDLNTDREKCDDVLAKFSFLNAVYVDISRFDLPRVICFLCYSSLSKAYDFLIKVRNAQSLIRAISPAKMNDTNEEAEQKSSKVVNVKQENEASDEDRKPNSFARDSTVSTIYCQNKDGHKEIVTQLTIEVDPVHSDDEEWNESILKKTLLGAPSTSKRRRSRRSAKKKEVQTDTYIKTWKEYHWTCGLCYIELADIATLRAHSLSVHNKCAEFACFICEKFFNFNSFILHAKSHHICLRNRCHYCDKEFDPNELKSHINHHLESQESCPNCGLTFPDAAALQEHLKSVIQKQKKPSRKGRWVKCPEKDRTCPTCGKVFNYVCLLKKHLEIHKPDRKREFACDQCGNMFFTKNELRLHFVIHREERLHVCSICNRGFKHAGNMKEHERTHSSEKPFSCETCGRNFRRRKQLDNHRVRHTDVTPFACGLCDKRFHFKACLVKHERRHTGYKPYSCDECERQFTDWGNFNKHMKRRHNRDMSKKKKAEMTEQITEQYSAEPWQAKMPIMPMDFQGLQGEPSRWTALEG